MTFTETAIAAALAITIVSGNNQLGVINSTLARPLVVAVSPATPARHNVSGEVESARERARPAVVGAALFTSGLSGNGQARC